MGVVLHAGSCTADSNTPINCMPHPPQLGEGGDRVGISSQYAPPLGIRLKSKLLPWTLGMTWGLDQDCAGTGLPFTPKQLILPFSVPSFLFADPQFFFACAQCQIPHL